jgi:hypothetical protein
MADVKDGIGRGQVVSSGSRLRAADHDQVPGWQYGGVRRDLETGCRQPVTGRQAGRLVGGLRILGRDERALPIGDPVAERNADADRSDAEEGTLPRWGAV